MRRCLRACEPAVFLLHQTLGAVEPDPFDPKAWRVTAMWTSLCTRCGKCVDVCPQKAIELSQRGFLAHQEAEVRLVRAPESLPMR